MREQRGYLIKTHIKTLPPEIFFNLLPICGQQTACM
nr:MAG TPA: hypothetical protein [Caudoviricetes sp.]